MSAEDFCDVDLAATDTIERLLDDVRAFVGRYIVMGDEQLDTVALWVLHTYAFRSWDVTPYLAIISPTMRSGKTNLLLLLEAVCNEGMLTANISTAALYRAIDELRPTLLMDEMDERQMSREHTGILNSGYKAGGYVFRSVQGRPTRFATFCPKAFASIGVTLSRTLVDRSVQVHMRRKLSHEQVERFRHATVRAGASTLVDRLTAWGEMVAADGTRFLYEPQMPLGLSDRQQEVWLPLLSIAEDAGADWPKRADAACQALTVEANQDEPDDAVNLLHDIKAAFGSKERLSSEDLLNRFRNVPEPLYNGPEITSKKGLAERLKQFRIYPQQLRIGERTLKGYYRDQFADSFERYVR